MNLHSRLDRAERRLPPASEDGLPTVLRVLRRLPSEEIARRVERARELAQEEAQPCP